MNKGIILTASIFLLLILSIIAVSAIVLYSTNDQRVVVMNPGSDYKTAGNMNYQGLGDTDSKAQNKNQGVYYNSQVNTVYSTDSTPKPCYNMLDQEKGCSPYVEVDQDRTPCTKTVTLSCGKQVTVSCDYSIDQIKGCGHLDTPDQTKDKCYKTVTLPCGKTAQVETSCYEEPDQVRAHPCYDSLDQVRNDCVNKKVTGCNSESQIQLIYTQNSCSAGYQVSTNQKMMSQDGYNVVYYTVD